jgi:hypothetical protein
MREPLRVMIKDLANIGRNVFVVQLRALSAFVIFVVIYLVARLLGIELGHTYVFLGLLVSLMLYVVCIARRLVYFVRGKKHRSARTERADR